MKKKIEIVAVSANIKGFGPMTQDKVLKCLEQIARRNPDMVGCQEMWLRRYKQGLRQVFPTYRHYTPWFSKYRGMSETLSLKPGNRPLGVKRLRQLHPAVPGEVDARQILIWPCVKQEVKVLYVNLHMLPDRVQGDDGPYYRQGIAELRKVMTAWRRRGFNIVITGDFNEGGKPLGDLFEKSRIIYATHVPDHVIAIPAPGYRARCTGIEILKNPSDHDAVVATMMFEEI